MLAIQTVDLLAECNKLIRRYERYARELRSDDVRRERRTEHPHLGQVRQPSYWQVDAAFNPFRVRANASAVVRAVNNSLRDGSYRPRPAIAHDVPKGTGTRTVSIFPIADSVVSRTVFNRLSEKNRSLASARSYAYRGDLSTHDAIQYIASEFDTHDRVYLAEYDFSKFFDTISHDHLRRTLARRGFLVTSPEMSVLEAFMAAPLLSETEYSRSAGPSERKNGVPQGTSVSLFLANAAAWPIDRALERLGVGFVRYADDTVIWSRDYGQIAEAANVLRRTSAEIGSELNYSKSSGVRLFTAKSEPAEITSTPQVEFVGYRFKRGSIGLRQVVVDRMKRRVEGLIWHNLLSALDRGTFQLKRVAPSVDRDYLVLILQIRRYLYGNLTESKIRQLERGSVKRIRYPGVMSYFPLVDDLDQLKSFDGWILSTLHLALEKRGRMIHLLHETELPAPHGLNRQDLARAFAQTSDGTEIDLRVPSVARFSSVLRRAAREYGANVVANGSGIAEYQYLVAQK